MVTKKQGKNKAHTSELKIKVSEGRFCLLGITPFIFNAMSEKVKQGLLMGGGKKTAAEKAGTAKHNPLSEYRDGVYRHRDTLATRLRFPAGGIKKAMAAAAIDLPGMKKAQVGRLTWSPERDVSIYGIPQLFMSVVRSADMNHTPDIRTRAILPEWATVVTFRCVTPILNMKQVADLLAAAGLFIGIGDWRQEKGSDNYGQFELVDEGDARFQAIVQSGGRAAQDAALADPAFYDDETEKLMAWYEAESERRGFAGNGATMPSDEAGEFAEIVGQA